MVFFKTWIIRSEAVLAWSRSIASYSFVVTTDTWRPMAAPSLRKSSRATSTSPRINARVAFRKSFSLIIVAIFVLVFLNFQLNFLIVLIGFVIVRGHGFRFFIVLIVIEILVLVLEEILHLEDRGVMARVQVDPIGRVQFPLKPSGILLHGIEVDNTDF